jgi:hypothetical protein
MLALKELCVCIKFFFFFFLVKMPQEPDEMVNLIWNLAKLVPFVLTEKRRNYISVHVCWYFQEKKFGITTVPLRVISDDIGTKGVVVGWGGGLVVTSQLENSCSQQV